jgi:hypothetical protein
MPVAREALADGGADAADPARDEHYLAIHWLAFPSHQKKPQV